MDSKYVEYIEIYSMWKYRASELLHYKTKWFGRIKMAFMLVTKFRQSVHRYLPRLQFTTTLMAFYSYTYRITSKYMYVIHFHSPAYWK